MVAGTGDDDDAEVQFIAFQLFTNGHGAFFMHEDFQMGVAALETGEDFGEEIGTHHGRDADFNGTLLQLLVIIDLKDGVLNVAQSQFHAVEKDGSFWGKRQLLLAAVKKLDTKFGLELFYRYGDVRLGNTESLGRSGDISQTTGHLEIFKLS